MKKAKSERVKDFAYQNDEPASSKERILIDSYGETRVFQEKNEALPLYEVPSPHYKGAEKEMVQALLDLSTALIPSAESVLLTEREKRAKYFMKIMEIVEATPELRIPVNSKEFFANAVVKEMIGFGLIDSLLQDDDLEEIMVIGVNKPVYVFHRKYGMMRSSIWFYDDVDIRNLIDRIARNVGRRIDVHSPLLDARLPNGTRVNATIPPVSLDGSTLTLRKFRKDPLSIIDIINTNTIDYEVAAFLWLAAEGLGAKPANIIIAGGTACGKTTTLNILTSFVPNIERLVTIEDTAELSLPFAHWIRFETRPPGTEGVGEVTMNTLVKNSLRMRPDRIIVGEIRGEEGYTLFSAMNTGHDGCFGTLHSNSARETIVRLQSPPISVPLIMLSSLNFVVMQQRIFDRRKGVIRRITELAEILVVEGEAPQIQVLYQWNPSKDVLEATGVQSNYFGTLSHYTGLSKEDLLKELDARKQILIELNKKGIRGLSDVSDVTQNYLMKRTGRL